MRRALGEPEGADVRASLALAETFPPHPHLIHDCVYRPDDIQNDLSDDGDWLTVVDALVDGNGTATSLLDYFSPATVTS